MKSILIAFVALLATGVVFGSAWSEVSIKDDFTNTRVEIKSSTSAIETYAFTPSSFGEVVHDMAVTRPLIRTRPTIEPSGPLGRTWVFSTGSSKQFRDVHWKHYVDLFYHFDTVRHFARSQLKALQKEEPPPAHEFIRLHAMGRAILQSLDPDAVCAPACPASARQVLSTNHTSRHLQNVERLIRPLKEYSSSESGMFRPPAVEGIPALPRLWN